MSIEWFGFTGMQTILNNMKKDIRFCKHMEKEKQVDRNKARFS